MKRGLGIIFRSFVFGALLAILTDDEAPTWAYVAGGYIIGTSS